MHMPTGHGGRGPPPAYPSNFDQSQSPQRFQAPRPSSPAHGIPSQMNRVNSFNANNQNLGPPHQMSMGNVGGPYIGGGNSVMPPRPPQPAESQYLDPSQMVSHSPQHNMMSSQPQMGHHPPSGSPLHRFPSPHPHAPPQHPSPTQQHQGQHIPPQSYSMSPVGPYPVQQQQQQAPSTANYASPQHNAHPAMSQQGYSGGGYPSAPQQVPTAVAGGGPSGSNHGMQYNRAGSGGGVSNSSSSFIHNNPNQFDIGGPPVNNANSSAPMHYTGATSSVPAPMSMASPLPHSIGGQQQHLQQQHVTQPENKPVFTEKEEKQRVRFQIELEFVQCLANPNYLHFLAQRGHFKDDKFINYLQYLLYWKKEKYIKYIKYPICLHFLELLQHEKFRSELVNGHNAKFLDDQVLLQWQYYTRKRLKLIEKASENKVDSDVDTKSNETSVKSEPNDSDVRTNDSKPVASMEGETGGLLVKQEEHPQSQIRNLKERNRESFSDRI